MTKKERAEFDAALLRARILAALRWTTPVHPDVPLPSEGYSQGWDYDAHTHEVWPAWSSRISHGRGKLPDDGSRPPNVYGSKGGRLLFSSQGRALAALRNDLEHRAADALVRIDERIAALQVEDAA